jgi:hypothetical protein
MGHDRATAIQIKFISLAVVVWGEDDHTFNGFFGMALGKGGIDADADLIAGESGFVGFEGGINCVQPVADGAERLADEGSPFEGGDGWSGEFDRFALAIGVIADLDAEISVIVSRLTVGGAMKGLGCIGEDALDLGGGHAEVDVGNALMGFDFEFDVELHGTVPC